MALSARHHCKAQESMQSTFLDLPQAGLNNTLVRLNSTLHGWKKIRNPAYPLGMDRNVACQGLCPVGKRVGD